MGRAASDQELLFPHTVVARMLPTGPSVNNTIPRNPTIRREMATHTPLANKPNSTNTSTMLLRA